MNKFLNYISIALIAFTLFSCDKNEWTPEKEADFKKTLKQDIQTKGKNTFSEKQIDYITDCTLEKVKSKNLKTNYAEKPEALEMIKKIQQDCAEESYIKTLTVENIAKVWDPEIIKTYKDILKNFFIKNGTKEAQATILADCASYRLIQQRILLSDLQNPAYKDIILNTGMMCEQIIMKNQIK